jgi:regulator of protease activity HflC (stomatin/prohibitin superfamily)
MEGIIIVTVFVVMVIITITLGVRIVPQGSKHVVQRLGKYNRTLNPGLNIIVPYMDTVAYKVTTKDIVLDVPSQEVITRDNAVIITNAISFINIVSPEKAVYGVEDYRWPSATWCRPPYVPSSVKWTWMTPSPPAITSRRSSRPPFPTISPIGESC